MDGIAMRRIYLLVRTLSIIHCVFANSILEHLSAVDGWRFYVTDHRSSDRPGYETLLISTPNANWSPWLRSSDAPVYLRADGTFGEDDPICWPQKHHPGAPHLPCIPLTDPRPHSLVHTFRSGLRKEQVTFSDDLDDGLRVGTLSEHFTRGLKRQVEHFTKDVQEFLSRQANPHPRLERLSRSLETTISKISRLQDTLPQLRLTFGLASRFYLEAQGYLKYHTILKATGKTTVDLNLVGVWVEDAHVCAEYHRMGVPVWYIRKPYQPPETSDKFVKFCEPRSYALRPLWPPGCFRDDGYANNYPTLLEDQTNIGNRLRVFDAWAESRMNIGFR